MSASVVSEAVSAIRTVSSLAIEERVLGRYTAELDHAVAGGHGLFCTDTIHRVLVLGPGVLVWLPSGCLQRNFHGQLFCGFYGRLLLGTSYCSDVPILNQHHQRQELCQLHLLALRAAADSTRDG
ncbi:hypothetical protein VTK56DRAFT_6677 [Thermocarpiscus australiensis]